jgi:hypothetical protein
MAIKLTCPGCRDAVVADEADRGKTIKCGTCWTDVPVPSSSVAQVKAVPVAKAVPAAPIAKAAPLPAGPKKATPLPAAAPLPAAKPVVASALPATSPLEPKEKSTKAEPAKKSRFKERDRARDDEDEDDTPRGNAKKGGPGVLIAFICIGAVMLLGVAGGVAVLVMNSQPTAAATTGGAPTLPKIEPPGGGFNTLPRNPGGDFNPGGGPGIEQNPNPPQPPPPVKPPVPRPQGWAEFRGKDFTCDMPGPVSKEPAKFNFAAREVSGLTYSAAEPNNAIKVTVKELNLPPGTSATSGAFVAAAFGLLEADLKRDPNGRLVSGNPGVDFSAAGDGFESALVAVSVGTKNAFLFRVQWKANTPASEEKRDNFLASLNVLLEGEQPVVRRPGERLDPNEVKPITVPWVKLENKDGFEVQLPPGAKKPERHVLELENRIGYLGGNKWVTDDGDVKYHVFVHDLPAGQLDLDLHKLAKPLVHSVFPYEVQGRGEDATVDGKKATRWDVREFNGNITHGVSVRVGFRVFTLFVTGMNNNKGATVNDRQDRFLSSIKITFDPKTHNLYADEPDWVAMKGTTGFTALIPRQATNASEFKPFFFDEAPKGREWKAELDGILYQVMVVDFSPRPGRNQLTDKNPQDLVDHLTNKRPASGPDKSKLGTLTADAYTVKAGFGDHSAHLRFAMNGRLVYVAKTSRAGDWNNRCGDKEFEDKTAKFFDTFRLGEGVIAQGGGGGGDAGGGPTGEFVKVPDTKVQPFWAGVFLPQAKEFMTFGVKDASARPLVRGVVRRYSLPDFKLKATYETPSPINRVSADEANGRLFAATVREAADAKQPEKDNFLAVGEVQQYDLFKLTDGSLANQEMVRPVNTVVPSNAAVRISGLEASPDGSAVYVSALTISGKTFRGKLVKWDTATRKLQSDISTDSAIGGLALSADGKKLYAIERVGDGTRMSGNLIVVDGPAWKRATTVPLAGLPVDVAVRSERAAVVVSPAQGQFKLLVGPADGDLPETVPVGELNTVRFTPGGTKLLVSAGGQASGLTLFDVEGGMTPKLTQRASAGELSGMFVISPDGKLAVMNTGPVLDLEKSKGK